MAVRKGYISFLDGDFAGVLGVVGKMIFLKKQNINIADI